MKNLILIFVLILSVTTVQAQKTNPNYDAELASKLGADDYGMKKFVFVMLKTGVNESTDKELKDKAFAGHMKNIDRLVKENKLVVDAYNYVTGQSVQATDYY